MKRGAGKSWKDFCSFSSVEEYQSWQRSSDHRWNLKRSYETSQGRVQLHTCSFPTCIALLKILFHATSQELSLFTFEDHNHEMNAQSNWNQARTLVTSLISQGIVKPSVIRTRLPCEIALSLSDVQLSNLIQRIKRASPVLPFRMTAADLKQFCIDNCARPVEQDQAFVVSFELADEEVVHAQPSFRVVFSTRRLLENGLRGIYWHVDATYKVVWQGFPVLLLGTCDQAKRFHPISLMLSQDEREQDYTYLLQKTRAALQDVKGSDVRPAAVIGDGAGAITNAVTTVFDMEMKRGMCWAHVIRNVDQRLRSVPSPSKERLRYDICSIQLAISQTEFDSMVVMFLQKWNSHIDSCVNEFVSYFEQQWISHLPNWYEGFTPNGPSTNNGLESTNRYFKEKTTFRERLPLNEFLLGLFRTLNGWSSERQPGGRKHFLQAPVIGTKEFTESWHWIQNGPTITETGNGWVCSTRSPGLDTDQILRQQQDFVPDFDAHVKTSKDVCRVEATSEYLGASCSCISYLKNYLCVHVIAYLDKIGSLKIPSEAKSVPLGQKRKRGRPKKVGPALSLI